MGIYMRETDHHYQVVLDGNDVQVYTNPSNGQYRLVWNSGSTLGKVQAIEEYTRIKFSLLNTKMPIRQIVKNNLPDWVDEWEAVRLGEVK